jgi:hypothetical protein
MAVGSLFEAGRFETAATKSGPSASAEHSRPQLTFSYINWVERVAFKEQRRAMEAEKSRPKKEHVSLVLTAHASIGSERTGKVTSVGDNGRELF